MRKQSKLTQIEIQNDLQIASTFERRTYSKHNLVHADNRNLLKSKLKITQDFCPHFPTHVCIHTLFSVRTHTLNLFPYTVFTNSLIL